MSNTRYGHSNVGGGYQDQGERKDDGWVSRQGGAESNRPGRKGEPEPGDAPGRDHESRPPRGTNTQGDLAGIGEASRDVEHEREGGAERAQTTNAQRDEQPQGTDQPPRMGGPLGPDPRNPHLPEGAQDSDNRGSGAGGFDRGVNAKVVGAVHQGAKPEDSPE